MRNSRSSWYILAFLFMLPGFLLCSCSSGSQSAPTASSSTSSQGASGSDAQKSTPVVPWWQGGHLVIPSLSINAPIEAVGVQTDGSMAVPTQKQWDGVGWYKYGAEPGEQGSAVIDGHLDRPGGAPAVFWKLRTVHAGDTVVVVRGDGKQLHFRVTGVEAYTPDVAPRGKIFTDKSGKYLNLITCAGQWIPAQHQTTQRLVVYTVFVQ